MGRKALLTESKLVFIWRQPLLGHLVGGEDLTGSGNKPGLMGETGLGQNQTQIQSGELRTGEGVGRRGGRLRLCMSGGKEDLGAGVICGHRGGCGPSLSCQEPHEGNEKHVPAILQRLPLLGGK